MFSSHYEATVAPDIVRVVLNIGCNKINMNILDTAGLERFGALASNYMRKADAVLLCFDVTNLKSFEHIEYWKNEFTVGTNPMDPPNYPFFLVSTKIDLQNQVVKQEMIKRWLSGNNKIPYFETSAKNDISVNELFNCIAKELACREATQPKEKIARPEPVILEPIGNGRKTGCC
ncbi:hypothetical protein HZS_6952 [Henneguya salminicola]|uniref:GTP-binding protein yptV5 (Trinotate prediction) n=1 Tax=Henneguya salminicola TaxID=69463 RepID=A0A6G3MGS7_HENSL|nr:hypothetical protein HZS_6952 [Henneguya salminicola]